MPEALMQDGRKVFLHAFARAVRPRKRLTVSQWSDAHRILTSKSSPEPGRWSTQRTPFVREPMDCLSDHSPHRKVVCMFPVQMAKTEIGLNWLGYIMDHSPAPVLSVQPTIEMRDRYITQRLNPMLEVTECIALKFNAKARRAAANNKDVKDFPGGILVLSGANSPTSLRSMPIKNVIVDELDAFPWDVRGEGDPLGLIEARQSNFSRSKILIISSPTMKDASRIEEEFLGGDQRYYHVQCPHCGEYQILQKKFLQFPRSAGKISEVFYVCPHNGCEIEEYHKTAMLKEQGFGGTARWVPENPGAEYPSYTINALCSSIGMGWSWRRFAVEWLKCQGDRVKLKRFINTRLAESWEDQSHKLKPRMLMDRAEDYALGSIPPGVLVLIAAIDTQNDRLPTKLVGYGRGGRRWVLDYVEFPGDPNNLIPEFIEKKGALYDYLKAPRVNAFGREMRIQAVAWDTGGQRTDMVYRAIRSRVLPRLMAIKGASISGKPILAARPSAQDVNWRGKIIKKGVMLWLVGTDTAKDMIVAHLAADAEKPAEERMIHFSTGLDEDYYKMLLAEKFDPEKNKWILPHGRRNEALDLMVYTDAASRHPEIRVHTMGKRAWDDLERRLEPRDKTEEEAPPEDFGRDSGQASRRKRKPGRKRGGFATNW